MTAVNQSRHTEIDSLESEAASLAEGLYPHQVEGVAFLLGRRRAILADDMGLGKTRQAIVALSHAEPHGPYLVVCPASVKRNWLREIAMVLPGADVSIVGPAPPPSGAVTGWVIVNYDILKRHHEQLLEQPWAGLVFDEAHYLKNHTSQRSRLGTGLVKAASSRAPVFALTGTPLSNRPRDLFPLLKLIGHPLGRSFLSFAKRYCAAEHNGFGWVTTGASNLEELTVQLHGALLRRNKDEVLDLPPKLRSWLPVEVAPGTALAESRAVVLELARGETLERIGRSSSGSDQDDGTGTGRTWLLGKLTKARRKLATAKVRSTKEIVENAVAQGEKVLVFSCFDEPLKKLHEHFGEQSVLLTGATPSNARQTLVDRFQADQGVRVLCANIVAGGVGLNLTAARQVVFNDLDWVPANHWQAEDRAYRIGQNAAVNVHYLVAQGTLDEFVATVLEAKSALVRAVVDGDALEGDVGPGVLNALEQTLQRLSPRLADLGAAELGEAEIERLLNEASQSWAAENGAPAAGSPASTVSALDRRAIEALARVLRGPAPDRYRVVSNSRAGAFYAVEVSAGDVLCTCPGFEYRGTCSHGRKLKESLVLGGELPAGFSRVGTDA